MTPHNPEMVLKNKSQHLFGRGGPLTSAQAALMSFGAKIVVRMGTILASKGAL